MKRAKSKSRKTTVKQSPASDYVSVVIDDAYLLKGLPQASRQRIFGIQGAIKQLCGLHNNLVDSRRLVSNGNVRHINLVMARLERSIDSRIEELNALLSRLQSSRRSIKRPKNPKKTRKAKSPQGRSKKSR